MFSKTVISLVLYEIFTGHQRKMDIHIGFYCCYFFLAGKMLANFLLQQKYKNLSEIYLLLLSQRNHCCGPMIWTQEVVILVTNFNAKNTFSPFNQKGGVLVPNVFHFSQAGLSFVWGLSSSITIYQLRVLHSL